MPPERWARVCELLEACSEFSAAERAAYLEKACGADSALRDEVESLVAASGEDAWIDRPAFHGIEAAGASLSPGPQSGDLVGHYRIVSELGHGAMGTIYKATDERLGRAVALKIISDANVGAVERERFVREAKAASALNHPNIVTIYEYSRDAGLDFIAMEYIEGSTLQQVLTKGPVPLGQALEWARQIAGALAKAHAAGIVHRDLKPGNLMVTPDGVVKILDFGIAMRARRLAEGPTNSLDLTLPGSIVGTPAYMSPEQARGEAVDHRSDIFSFGTILYEMLCGLRLFTGLDSLSVLHSIAHKDTPPTVLADARIPRRVSELIGRCVARDRAERLQEIGSAAEELRAMQESPTLQAAGAVARPARERRWVRPLLWAAPVLVLVIAVGWYATKRAPHAGVTAVAGTPFELTEDARAKIQRYDKTGNLDAAITQLQQAIRANAEHAPAYAALAEAYLRKNTNSADATWRNLAAQDAEKAVALDPQLAYGHTVLGMSLMERAERTQAAAQFRQALDLDPKSGAALVGLAKVAVAEGDPAKAEKLFQNAADVAPSDWVPRTEFGLFRYRSGQFEAAAKLLERARDLAPDNIIVRRNLAGTYSKLDRQDDAATELQRALEIRPYAPIYTNLGTIRFYQGRYFEALPLMERAVQLGANRHIDWGNLADVYRLLPGYEAKAATAYATAIQLAREALAGAPEDADVRGSLIAYLARSGDCAGAEKEIGALNQLKRKTPNSLFYAAIASEVCGKRDKALEFLRSALEGGFPVREAGIEPDLVKLREDARYHLLVATFTKQKP